MPLEIVTFECKLSVMALCIVVFFNNWHALGKWSGLEVSDSINDFILGLICNMIAFVGVVNHGR